MLHPHSKPVWRHRVRRLVLAGAFALALSGQVVSASAAPKDQVSTLKDKDQGSTNVNWNSGHG